MDILINFLWALLEGLLPIIVLVLVPILGALIKKVFDYIGVQLDAKARDALQTAIHTGALEAVRRMGGPAVATKVAQTAIDAGAAQVLKSVPDAIQRFGLPEAEIARRVEARAVDIVQSTPEHPSAGVVDLRAKALDTILDRIHGASAR